MRAPDHLGDGVMALPAVAELAARHHVTVAAARWGSDLYRGLGVRLVPTADTSRFAAQVDLAVLLKPSFSAAWQTRHARRRVGEPTDHRRLLLTHVVSSTAPHRADRLLAVGRAALEAVGDAVGDTPAQALPSFAPQPQDGQPLPTDLPKRMVVLLPGTASADTVRWRRFQALTAALGARAVLTGGPGDEEILASLSRAAPAATTLRGLRLPALASLVARAQAVVGNDSGLPHFATAAIRGAGGDPACVHIVYASTDRLQTGPPGSTAWLGPQPDCWPCYAKRCHLGAAPCRDAAPSPLLTHLGELGIGQGPELEPAP